VYVPNYFDVKVYLKVIWNSHASVDTPSPYTAACIVYYPAYCTFQETAKSFYDRSRHRGSK